MVILFVGLLAGILFLLQQYAYKKWWSREVNVFLQFETENVTVGGYVNLLETVENRKRLPLPSLKVKFQCARELVFANEKNSSVTDKYYRNDLFAVMPYNRVIRTHKVYCPKRGYYEIDGIDIVGADIFLSQEMSESRSSATSLYVFPAPLRAKELDAAVMKINGEIAAKRYELEDPFTHRGIREYESYDEMKKVNWKATAKTGDLKVNIRDYTAVSAVRIFMNLQDNYILRREELLEMSISICAYLAEYFIAQGIHLSIYSNARDCISNQILKLTGNSDRESLNAIYRALARLNTDEKTKDFEECFGKQLLEEEQSLYTIVIASDRNEKFQDLLISYSEKENFTWICPVIKKEAEHISMKLKKYTIMISEEEN